MPQYHYGLTGVLSKVTTRFQNAEALCPVVAAQRDTDREMHDWEHLPLTSQREILAASAFNRLTILLAPPPYLNYFFNARNATALQSDYALK